MSVARLHDELLAAGLPVAQVTGSDRSIASVKYERTLSRDEQAQADAILAQFDPDAPDPRDVRRARLRELAAGQPEAIRLLIEEIVGV